MQPFASLQSSGGPPTQAPPLHTSAVVQAFPSLHAAELFECTHPLAGLQESLVQTLPSLQSGGGPPAQAPPLQVSAVVHAFPSLHAAVLFVWTQPVAGLQESSVQPLASLQSSAGPPAHAPLVQVSAVVHALPSLQAAELLVWTQPVAGLHESSVQPLESLQASAGPPAHAPPLQVSDVVQASPSLHGATLSVCMQPVPGMQESSVQGLPSSQLNGDDPAQAPPEQTSPVEQGSPSSQGAALFVWTQPIAVLQESSVQTLPSLQSRAAPPAHAPPLQVSDVVHAFPSLHAAVLFV